jgi:hypothetical protein
MFNVTVELGEVEKETSLTVAALNESIRVLITDKSQHQNWTISGSNFGLTKSFSIIPVSRIPRPPPCKLELLAVLL